MFFKLIKKRGCKFSIFLVIIFGFLLISTSTKANAAAPNYTQSWLNTSLLATGYMVNFSTNWTDDSGLDSFIFSINQSGTYVNSTARGFKGLVNNSANVTRITAPYGYNVTWRFWANDSGNAWNVTSVQSFIVTCDYNGTGNWNINTTCIVSQRSFQIKGNITIFNSGNLSLINTNLTINNSDYLKFITVNSQGILEFLDLDNNNNTMQDRTKIIGLLSQSCTGTIGVDCNAIVGDPTCSGYSTNVCTYNGGNDNCDNVYASCSSISSMSICSENLCTVTNNPGHGLGASRNSKIIFKNSYMENFGLYSGGLFGKNGFDLNGSSAIINNTFSNTNIIAIYNNDTIFNGNNINSSFGYMTLIGTENVTINDNNYNVTSSSVAALLLDNTNNINVTHNSFLSNFAAFVGIKTQDSRNINIFNNVINSFSGTLNQPEMYILRTNNSNVSYNRLLGASTNLLIWDSYNNLIEYTNSTSTSANSLVLINSSLNNINEMLINTSTSGGGINLVQSHNNSIKNVNIEHKSNGIIFDLSSDNKLNNIYVRSYTSNTNSTKFITNSANNIISNSMLNSTGKDLTTISGYNYFRNVSFNQSSNYASGSAIVNVQWYLDVNVSYYNGSAAANTNVTLFNRTSIYYFSDLAGSDGLVARKNTTEYIFNGTGKITYTNYTVTANTSAPGILNYSSSALNITTNMQWNISLSLNTAPNYTQSWINTSLPILGDLINFSSNWTDDTSLDSFMFSINQSGTYVNATSRAFPGAGTSNTASNVTRITAPPGYNLTWVFWANDSGNSWNVTPVQSFIILDSTPPQWIAGSIQKNQTTIYQNTLINFTANWTDNVRLDSWIFSLNQSGTYVNSSSIAFAIGLNMSSNISMINASFGTNVTYKFWVNDSSNNWNYSEESFLVSSVASSTAQNNSGNSGSGPLIVVPSINNTINEGNITDLINNKSSVYNSTYRNNQNNLSNETILRSLNKFNYDKDIIILLSLISIGFLITYLIKKHHKNN